MKRLLCSLLAFLLCVPLLSLSASAATIPGQYDVVDLLESGFFDEKTQTVPLAFFVVQNQKSEQDGQLLSRTPAVRELYRGSGFFTGKFWGKFVMLSYFYRFICV